MIRHDDYVFFEQLQGSHTAWSKTYVLGFSPVKAGAYFGGKAFGRTPLGAISPAAGATSPSKTVEGALSGIAATAAVATLGARLLRWPRPLLSGIAYGSLMGVVALLGDLTASMFKRDAGVKDFGDMFPGHGGMLDRFDSYIMTGVASYAFACYALPLFGSAV